MIIGRLDGVTFARMLENGLQNLRARENEINKMNVFPVADGDTGTNMRLTLEYGIRYAADSAPSHIGVYLCAISNGMLLGARGNSGVILSQIFKGISGELSRTATINVGDLRNAFIHGYRAAYASVTNPVEGTILTVAREGIENIRRQITRGTGFDSLLSMYVAEMKQSLARTPELLPALKKAGVVDSGAMGYICIIEGMRKYLCGEIVPAAKAEDTLLQVNDSFNESSRFEDGYCTEFLLQLMNGQGYLQNFELSSFIDNLTLYGSSIVTARDGSRVRVHIHTKSPDKVIALARQYGEFVTFKLENMQIQHNEILRAKEANESAPRKDLAIVTVADGDGMKALFAEFGCDAVLDGGEHMNPSAGDFLAALESLNAERVVIFPNNANTVSAAEQARLLYRSPERVTVLPCGDMLTAYFALAMQDDPDPDARIAKMRETVSSSHILSLATAVKDYESAAGAITAGDTVALLDGRVKCGGKELREVLRNALSCMEDTADKALCLLCRGEGVGDDECEQVRSLLEEALPDLEINLLEGGFRVYRFMIGLY